MKRWPGPMRPCWWWTPWMAPPIRIKRLHRAAMESGTALVVLLNKWDAIDPEQREMDRKVDTRPAELLCHGRRWLRMSALTGSRIRAPRSGRGDGSAERRARRVSHRRVEPAGGQMGGRPTDTASEKAARCRDHVRGAGGSAPSHQSCCSQSERDNWRPNTCDTWRENSAKRYDLVGTPGPLCHSPPGKGLIGDPRRFLPSPKLMDKPRSKVVLSARIQGGGDTDRPIYLLYRLGQGVLWLIARNVSVDSFVWKVPQNQPPVCRALRRTPSKGGTWVTIPQGPMENPITPTCRSYLCYSITAAGCCCSALAFPTGGTSPYG